MLKLPKLVSVPRIYPPPLSADEIADFITNQIFEIISKNLWNDKERQVFARAIADTASESDRVISRRMDAKIDALILYQTESLGLDITFSSFVMVRMQMWMTLPEGKEFFIEWGKRLAMAARMLHGKRPPIKDNPQEYFAKSKMVTELKSLAAMLRIRDLLNRSQLSRTDQTEALTREIQSIIRTDRDKFRLLAANIRKWKAFFQAQENEKFVYELVAEHPALANSV
jgi:hypothetical protein